MKLRELCEQMIDDWNNKGIRYAYVWHDRYLLNCRGEVYSLYRAVGNGGKRRLRATPFKMKTDTADYKRIKFYKSKSKVKQVHLHTLVLETFVGKRPKGKQAAHKNGNCRDNRIENLYWATQEENCADKVRHGTATVGSKNPQAKLNEEDVLKILSRKETAKVLAKEFGVNRNTILKIKSRQSWKHVKARECPGRVNGGGK